MTWCYERPGSASPVDLGWQALAYIAFMTPLLAEELVVLARSPGGGSLLRESTQDRGVAGALLADLAAARRIGCIEGQLVVVTDRAATGRPALDTALQQIATGRDRFPRGWIGKLASQQEGAVRQVKDLQGWRGARDPDIVPRREELLTRLSEVFTTDAGPGARTAALAAPMAACGLSGKLFPGVDRRVRKRHLAQISAGQWAAAGVHASRRAALARNVAMAPIWIFLMLPW
jgi:Golgi phosphoprotein 3 (GPP34)